MMRSGRTGFIRILSLCTAGLVLLTACSGGAGNGQGGQEAQGSAGTAVEAASEAGKDTEKAEKKAEKKAETGAETTAEEAAADTDSTGAAGTATAKETAAAGTGDTAAAAGSAVSAVPGAEDTEAAVDEAALAAEADRILGGMSMDEKISQMIIPAIRTWDEQDVTDLDQVPALAEALQDWRFDIEGFVGYERCVVTAGGVSTDEVLPKTLESRLHGGLYLCGEVLDIDADTGGYNLQLAFSTGLLAGQSAARSLTEKNG